MSREPEAEMDDSDDWDSSDADDDPTNENSTTPCPFCGEDIYDDAERCPACGNYLSSEDATASKRPLWIVIGVAICLAIAIACAIFG